MVVGGSYLADIFCFRMLEAWNPFITGILQSINITAYPLQLGRLHFFYWHLLIT